MSSRRSKRITVWRGDQSEEESNTAYQQSDVPNVDAADIVISIQGDHGELAVQPKSLRRTMQNLLSWMSQDAPAAGLASNEYGLPSGVVSVTVQESATATRSYTDHTDELVHPGANGVKSSEPSQISLLPELNFGEDLDREVDPLLEIEDAPLYLSDPLACSLKAVSSPRLVLERSTDFSGMSIQEPAKAVSSETDCESHCDTSRSAETTPDASPESSPRFEIEFENAGGREIKDAGTLACSLEAVESPKLRLDRPRRSNQSAAPMAELDCDVTLHATWQPQKSLVLISADLK